MSPGAKRVLVPLGISIIAIGIVTLVMLNPNNKIKPAARDDSETKETVKTEDVTNDTENEVKEPPAEGGEEDNASEEQFEGKKFDLENLKAVAPAGGFDDDNLPENIGSLDWRDAKFLIEFSSYGAGIDRITMSDIWITARVKREVEAIKKKIEAGQANVGDLPAEDRYVVQQARKFRIGQSDWVFPSFVARTIIINDNKVSLFDNVWSQDVNDPGLFTTEIRNEDDAVVLRITRYFTISKDKYDITVEQKLENLTGMPLTIQWLQYGQADVDVDRAAYLDRRRYMIGHLADATRVRPENQFVSSDGDFFLERKGVIKSGTFNRDSHVLTKRTLWPTEESIENNLELSWFAAENRYFGVAIHPTIIDGIKSPADLSLQHLVKEIRPFYDGKPDELPGSHDNIAFELWSPEHRIAGGETLSLDFSVYAGPLDRHALGNDEPYASLNMSELILYQLSSLCGFCTFQWLAHLLLMFLSLMSGVTGDWGIAIILLVVVVRIMLHPITKKSQVSMARFGKAMQKLKPDLDKLKEKYGSEPKRLQQEQMRLWKEHGVNPASALGCLPMFLQTPIWIALYASLYFAWDLHHQPAFWGVFQMFGGWSFLGDLSSGDHFLGEFDEPISFLLWSNVTGINILPILMGVIFFFQQKYMTPPSAATMSPEQQQMQKMMKILFPIMFPLMLYAAPSGLTLYIMTSSCWGIIESRHIRSHINEMDVEKSIVKKKPKKKKKPRDPQARAYLAAVERAKAKKKKPSKKFKKKK